MAANPKPFPGVCAYVWAPCPHVKVMGFQQSYLNSWKMMLIKCRTQYVSRYGKPSSGHRTRKDQSSSQFPRRAVQMNVQTTRQLHSSPMLARLYSKSCMTGHVNQELPDVQAWFRKGRETRGQTANIHWIIEKAREFQKNIYLCFIDSAKSFDCVDHNKL